MSYSGVDTGRIASVRVPTGETAELSVPDANRAWRNDYTYVQMLGYGPLRCFAGDLDECLHPNVPVFLKTGRRSDSGCVHHLDGDHANNVMDNIVPMHHGCHTMLEVRGREVAQVTRDLIADSKRGKPRPDVAERAWTMDRAYQRTDEYRAMMSDALLGRVVTPEHARKIVEGRRKYQPGGLFKHEKANFLHSLGYIVRTTRNTHAHLDEMIIAACCGVMVGAKHG